MFLPRLPPAAVLIVSFATWEARCRLSGTGGTSADAWKKVLQAEGDQRTMRAYTASSIDQDSTSFGQISGQGSPHQMLVSLGPLSLFPETAGLRAPEGTSKYSHYSELPNQNVNLQGNELDLRLKSTSSPHIGRPAAGYFHQSIFPTSSSRSPNKRKYCDCSQSGPFRDPREKSEGSVAEDRLVTLHQNKRSKEEFRENPSVEFSLNWRTSQVQENEFDLSMLLPRFWRQKINQIINVKDDGNCGYRAAAISMGRAEGEWPLIRYEMYHELRSNPIFRNKNLIEVIFNHPVETVAFNLLDFDPQNLQKQAPENSWMTFPGHAFLLAETYKRPVIFISSKMCYTVPPLSCPITPEPPISMAMFDLMNHFTTFSLKDANFFPLPQIISAWKKLRLEVAKSWFGVLGELEKLTKKEEEEFKLKCRAELIDSNQYETIE